MKDCNCIFCKIANGEIPSTTLYEDEDFRVILDLGPATRGHALLLPKEHYQDLFALDDETASKVLVTAKKVAGKIKKAMGADGFNLVQNNGEAAGQTVFHFHMHMIPGTRMIMQESCGRRARRRRKTWQRSKSWWMPSKLKG